MVGMEWARLHVRIYVSKSELKKKAGGLIKSYYI